MVPELPTCIALERHDEALQSEAKPRQLVHWLRHLCFLDNQTLPPAALPAPHHPHACDLRTQMADLARGTLFLRMKKSPTWDYCPMNMDPSPCNSPGMSISHSWLRNHYLTAGSEMDVAQNQYLTAWHFLSSNRNTVTVAHSL